MKVFETDALRFSVQGGPVDGTWEVVIEAPGTKLRPIRAMSGGEGPESDVAIDLINQIYNIHTLGVMPYVQKLEKEFGEGDSEQLKKMAAAFFQLADTVGIEEFKVLGERIQTESLGPQEAQAIRDFQKAIEAKWEFGDLTIDVRPREMMTPEIVGYHVRFQKPGTPLYEDLMQRPVGYYLGQIAKEQATIMRQTLAMGIEMAAQRFLKANYMGQEYLPQMTQHATNIFRIATAIGDAELARIVEALEPEIDKEHEIRKSAVENLEKVKERREIERLEARERQLVQRIEALKKRLAERGR